MRNERRPVQLQRDRIPQLRGLQLIGAVRDVVVPAVLANPNFPATDWRRFRMAIGVCRAFRVALTRPPQRAQLRQKRTASFTSIGSPFVLSCLPTHTLVLRSVPARRNAAKSGKRVSKKGRDGAASTGGWMGDSAAAHHTPSADVQWQANNAPNDVIDHNRLATSFLVSDHPFLLGWGFFCCCKPLGSAHNEADEQLSKIFVQCDSTRYRQASSTSFGETRR